MPLLVPSQRLFVSSSKIEQIILSGSESIEKWDRNKDQTSSILYSYIRKNTFVPYFFKNDAVSKKVFLAQNTDTYGKATNIIETWVKKFYNIGIYAEDKVVKVKSKKDIKILGYKIGEDDYYTVLLPV